jgi:GNAT superfamily N-acetyltransferase
MLVRLVGPDDVPAIIELAREMHGEAPFYRDLTYDPQKVEDLCRLCLNENNWLCLVAEDKDGAIIGFLAAVATPALFGPDIIVEDLAFYVRPQSRGTTAAVRMLRILEGWAPTIDAKRIRMGITTGTNPEQTSRFLNRFDYIETGWLYTKIVCPLPETQQ